MTIVTSSIITLEEFLQLPETKPATEYIDGEILKKPMPKGRHSRLQSKLCMVINQVTEAQKIAYAFSELRCSFGGRSLVPDVAVFYWSNIAFDQQGEISDNFNLSPDWTIEILSPEQRPNKVIDNILHCLQYGCKLGWFIDPDDHSILIFSSEKQPQLFKGDNILPMLDHISINLTVKQVFDWLKMGK